MKQAFHIKACPPTEETFKLLRSLEAQVFDPSFSEEKIRDRLNTRENPLILVAYGPIDLSESREKDIPIVPVGFKVGYEEAQRVFYSWIGGVLPSHRSLGIARALMNHQHQALSAMGYQEVRTKTCHRFESMLRLNIKFGFERFRPENFEELSEYDQKAIYLRKPLLN